MVMTDALPRHHHHYYYYYYYYYYYNISMYVALTPGRRD